ncbi:MAG: pyridoxine 5'-phosphate synthase [Candidatus Omnitrophica bacterium]|nr:pyridoxine 5'-phosphate synthase [Candidatus Omnitrophota bacterium]
MPKLGVNIDHVATIRQARLTIEPDPVWAAAICEMAGCDSIVAHLREDRRHIQDRDVEILRKTVRTRLNLEMSANREIVSAARMIRPDQSTLVPEKRMELTTEGGLDVKGNLAKIKTAAGRLKDRGITVSLFIDPDKPQIEASKKAGVNMIELHTGNYAEAFIARGGQERDKAIAWEFGRIKAAVEFGRQLGMVVNAGHGLTYQNAAAIAGIPGIDELNIGHSIIARAVLVGLDRAVREMKALII